MRLLGLTGYGVSTATISSRSTGLRSTAASMYIVGRSSGGTSGY
jgi:hypothetical protein